MRGFAVLGLALAALAIGAGSASASNGGLIAFGSGSPTHVWTVKPNGKAARDLNAGDPKTYCAPALSPDGTRIAYVDYDTHPPLSPANESVSTLVVANSDGSAARSISAAWVFASTCLNTLSWAPDGHQIAYAGSGVGLNTQTGITVIDVDSPVPLARTLVSDTMRTYFDPQWSPDGTRIATFADDARSHVFTVDGSAPPVTSPGTYCDPTSWSPDSTSLLVRCGDGPTSSAEEKGLWNVRAVDLDGLLPVYPGNAYDGRYSPDGKRIAMRLNGQLATMPADGSAAPTVLLDRYPYGISWSR